MVVSGKVAGILLVRITGTMQAEGTAGVLPRLALAVPVKPKLGQLLPLLGGGLGLELHPNPLADHFGEIEQVRIDGVQEA